MIKLVAPVGVRLPAWLESWKQDVLLDADGKPGAVVVVTPPATDLLSLQRSSGLPASADRHGGERRDAPACGRGGAGPGQADGRRPGPGVGPGPRGGGPHLPSGGHAHLPPG